MRVKVIRGSIKYNGIVYEELKEFDIKEEDFDSIQENVEVISFDEEVDIYDTDKNNKEPSGNINNEGKENTPEGDIDYAKLKKDELIAIAKDRQIEFTDKTTKDELISLLENQGK